MTVFWIAVGLLSVAMLAAGVVKLLKPRDELETMGMLWVADYTDQQVRLIGAAETAGAIGLVVPAATGIAAVLSPIAAVCLGVLMAGAFGVHVRRKDPLPSLIITASLVGLAGYIAWIGFSSLV